jgi:hypothetical protein
VMTACACTALGWNCWVDGVTTLTELVAASCWAFVAITLPANELTAVRLPLESMVAGTSVSNPVPAKTAPSVSSRPVPFALVIVVTPC